MNTAPSRNFRGSAAFFAMLLAASSGIAAEAGGLDTTLADRLSPASPQALASRALSLSTASKFTRRRPPLMRRSADTAPRG